MNAISHREAAAPAIRPQSFLELERFAQLAAKSDFVPKDYRGRPDNVMVAIQMGSELGLAPMQSLQNISVINGRPSVWGDAMLALCRRSPLCEDVQETSEGEGDNLTAICLVRRKGASPVIVPFSVADAKKAGLWGKQGPWQQYPHRMLQLRARGFALRDAFPDLLRGLMSAEEAGDIPPGPTIEGEPEPTPPPAPKKAKAAAPEAEPQAAPDTGGNGDAPEPKRSKLTISEWLDGLKIRLDTCATQADVDAIVQSADVRKATGALQGKALEELNAVIHAALERTFNAEPASNEITPADRLMSG